MVHAIATVWSTSWDGRKQYDHAKLSQAKPEPHRGDGDGDGACDGSGHVIDGSSTWGGVEST